MNHVSVSFFCSICAKYTYSLFLDFTLLFGPCLCVGKCHAEGRYGLIHYLDMVLGNDACVIENHSLKPWGTVVILTSHAFTVE